MSLYALTIHAMEGENKFALSQILSEEGEGGESMFPSQEETFPRSWATIAFQAKWERGSTLTPVGFLLSGCFLLRKPLQVDNKVGMSPSSDKTLA